MRKSTLFLLSLIGVTGFMQATASAQPAPASASTPAAKDNSNSSVVTRMMKFDKNEDGKISADEMTDQRLKPLFDRADADKDGTVTKDELTALAGKMATEEPSGGRRGGGPGGGGPD